MPVKEMSPEEVRKIARLINISLNDQEVGKFQTTIPQTLNTIAVLNELDTGGIPPTSQVNGLHNIFKDPPVRPSLTQEEALQNTKEKERERGLFVTKAVFDRT